MLFKVYAHLNYGKNHYFHLFCAAAGAQSESMFSTGHFFFFTLLVVFYSKGYFRCGCIILCFILLTKE